MPDDVTRGEVIRRAICAMISALGMQAENQQREALGQSMAYVEDDFINLITEHGIEATGP